MVGLMLDPVGLKMSWEVVITAARFGEVAALAGRSESVDTEVTKQ